MFKRFKRNANNSNTLAQQVARTEHAVQQLGNVNDVLFASLQNMTTIERKEVTSKRSR